MYRKFIITDDGVLRFGRVAQHRDLLEWGEECSNSGGFWTLDGARGALLLFGRSFNFGAPAIEHVRFVDWDGAGGVELPLFYLPEWPREGAMIPVVY